MGRFAVAAAAFAASAASGVVVECPEGQQSIGGVCDTVEVLTWEPCLCSADGRSCARSVKVAAKCPTNHELFAADLCRLETEIPYEKFCPEGYALEDGVCRQYRGLECLDGELITLDGLCVSGLRVPISFYCPTGEDFRYFYDPAQQVCLLESVREIPDAQRKIAAAAGAVANQFLQSTLVSAVADEVVVNRFRGPARIIEGVGNGGGAPGGGGSGGAQERKLLTVEERKVYRADDLAPAVNAYVGCATGQMFDIVDEGTVCLANAVQRTGVPSGAIVEPTIVCNGDFDLERQRCYAVTTAVPEYVNSADTVAFTVDERVSYNTIVPGGAEIAAVPETATLGAGVAGLGVAGAGYALNGLTTTGGFVGGGLLGVGGVVENGGGYLGVGGLAAGGAGVVAPASVVEVDVDRQVTGVASGAAAADAVNALKADALKPFTGTGSTLVPGAVATAVNPRSYAAVEGVADVAGARYGGAAGGRANVVQAAGGAYVPLVTTTSARLASLAAAASK